MRKFNKFIPAKEVINLTTNTTQIKKVYGMSFYWVLEHPNLAIH